MKKGAGRLGAVCHCVKLTVPHPRESRTLVTLASDLQLSPPSNSGISGVNPIKDWSLLVFNLRDPIKVCSKKVSVHDRIGIVPMPSEVRSAVAMRWHCQLEHGLRATITEAFPTFQGHIVGRLGWQIAGVIRKYIINNQISTAESTLHDQKGGICPRSLTPVWLPLS